MVQFKKIRQSQRKSYKKKSTHNEVMMSTKQKSQKMPKVKAIAQKSYVDPATEKTLRQND